jgi:hypothetical protein
MLYIELDEYGVENTIREIQDHLKSVLGQNISKKQKDGAISRALGAMDALYYMIQITEAYTESESDT